MIVILLSAVAFISTLAGGIFCLYKKERQLLMAIVCGILLGTVIFELLPEVHYRSHVLMYFMILVVFGFYKKRFDPHHIGIGSAILLCVHSFFDGLGIGVGFLVNPTIGILVAIAVIAHDTGDGVNTVSIMINYGNTIKTTIILLIIDATAPIVGVLSTYIIHFPVGFITEYLSFFCAFLCYIVVIEILPQLLSNRRILQSALFIAI